MTSAEHAWRAGDDAAVVVLHVHAPGLVVMRGYTDQSVFASRGNPFGVNVTRGKRAAIRHRTQRLVETAARPKR